MRGGSAARWLTYRLGLARPGTQVSSAEHACLLRHAAGRRSLVEIGVMHGVTTALLRSVMHPEGTITGIDPHQSGWLGVSFERMIACREVTRHARGHAVLVRKLSAEAAVGWTAPIDFLFIDGDHSWAGIERDWHDWSDFIASGGLVALHDSRKVPSRADLDSVRYTREVISHDRRFRLRDSVESLTVLERVTAGDG